MTNMDYIKTRIGLTMLEIEQIKKDEFENKVFRIRPYGVIKNETFNNLVKQVGYVSQCLSLLILEVEEMSKE